MMASARDTLKRITFRLARADIPFFILPPLMLLLIAGTIAQKDLGIYEAQHRFFSSFILWIGPLPLPGGYTLIGLLTFSLTFKFLLDSAWTWKKAGINLAHLGVLVLMFGGLITAVTAREGYMVIPEGQQTPYLYDYFDRRLYIYKDDALLQSVPFEHLQTQDIRDLPFALRIHAVCGNCQILKRADTPQDFAAGDLRGMARFMALAAKPLEKEAEANLGGLTLAISGLNEEQNGVYVAFDGMPKPIEITAASSRYKIIAGKSQRALPFSLKLVDFVKESYPGTEKAKAYSADVVVIDNGVEWPARIEMNQPLRYKGYTFYQSSFERGMDDSEITILSVVENKGRLFPYLGTLIVAAGILLHLILLTKKRSAAP